MNMQIEYKMFNFDRFTVWFIVSNNERVNNFMILCMILMNDEMNI